MEDSVYKATHNVYFHDMDLSGGIRISSLMNYCAEDAGCHCTSFGLDYDFLAENNFVFILSRIDIKLLQSPIISDKISVDTWHSSIKGPFFNRIALIKSCDNIVAQYISSWVIINISNRSIIKPDAFPYSLPMHQEAGYEDVKAAKLRNREGLEYICTVPVCYSHIDRNLHLNNTKYVDIVLDSLVKGYDDLKPIRRLSINYIKECVLGDRIDIFAEYGETIFVKGVVGGETSFLCEIELAEN